MKTLDNKFKLVKVLIELAEILEEYKPNSVSILNNGNIKLYFSELHASLLNALCWLPRPELNLIAFEGTSEIEVSFRLISVDTDTLETYPINEEEMKIARTFCADLFAQS